MTLDDINLAIQQAGLTPRGAFNPDAGDGVPEFSPGRPARTLVLAGNAGPIMWDTFSAQRDHDVDLLDDWSRDVLWSLAQSIGAVALFPFERPYLPFQRWAQRGEPCQASPLGMFIHPDYGLWHGYRGALALGEHLQTPPADPQPRLCDDCPDQPCLTSCPVDAFTDGHYDVGGCVRHLGEPDGADCMDLGCRARRACPYGQTSRYQPAQAHFHMRAFLKNHQSEE